MKIRNLLYTFIAGVAVFALAMSSSFVTSAEGPACPGAITGETILSADTNAGQIQFDGETGIADLSIVGGGIGFAPADVVDAACVSVFDPSDPTLDYFSIKGYAWNTNAGFIDFSECGLDCHVEILPEVGNTRQLSGTAWNAVFGYIYLFDTNPGDGIDYGVSLEKDGDNWKFADNSWAWTDAKVWINMSGPSVTIPVDEDDLVINDCALDPSSCKPGPKPKCKGVCLNVVYDPPADPADPVGPVDPADPADPAGPAGPVDSLLFGFGVDDVAAIADGVSGYDVYISLRDANNMPLIDSDEIDLDSFSMTFSWKDTVKLNQLKYETGDYDDMEHPVQVSDGGVVYKPIQVGFDDLVHVGKGFYKLKKGKIKSIAPTSNMNLSKMSSMPDDSAFIVQNGVFLWPLSEDNDGEDIWTDDIESNDLILENTTFVLNDANGNPVLGPDGKPVANKVLYANESPGLSFPFRPAVEMDTLYANDKQDIISAYRDIDFWLTMRARKIGQAVFTGGPQITAKIDYSIPTTLKECYDGGQFNIHFNNDGDTKSETFSLSELSNYHSLSAVAEIPGDGPAPCSRAEGPTVYSEVNYTAEVDIPLGVSTEVAVKYYHNMLPKLAGSDLANTQIYVSGTVKGNTAFNPASDVNSVTTSGNVNTNIVRDTIYENLQNYANVDSIKSTSLCEISALGAKVAIANKKTCKRGYYTVFDVGDEHIFYAKSDISLNFSSPSWTGKWVIVSDGGHIYYDADVYNGALSADNHIAAVALRGADDEIGESGNAYIHPDVKNLQLTTVLDGTLMSYFGLRGYGTPPGNLTSLVDDLQNQLLIQGSIFSRNTIGGYNYNKDHGFRLLGSGEIVWPSEETPELLYQIIMEDLHFLRLFKLEVQVDPDNGLPYDFSCGMGLTSQQTKAIIDKSLDNTLEGVINEETGEICDGIDVLNAWSGDICKLPNVPDGTPCGDLYVDSADDRRAEGIFESGLDADEVNLPVYVIYTKIPDSVIFSNEGAVVY